MTPEGDCHHDCSRRCVSGVDAANTLLQIYNADLLWDTFYGCTCKLQLCDSFRRLIVQSLTLPFPVFEVNESNCAQ